MKVLLINGSPRKGGNTSIALAEVAQALQADSIETLTIAIGTHPMPGCIACASCKQTGRCAFHDDVYEQIRQALPDADALIIGSPTYFAGPNGSLCALLDRVFYSLSPHLAHKPAACVAVCRRGGASATFDRLNKYFTITQMPVVSSQYWNSVHGALPGEASQDGEGLQVMRTLGHNMAWLLRNIHNGNAPLPQPEPPVRTNFIR